MSAGRRTQRVPFVAVIDRVRGTGSELWGQVGGFSFSAGACVGFEPAAGMSVWVYELGTLPGQVTQAWKLYLLHAAPPDVEALAARARQEEAAEAAEWEERARQQEIAEQQAAEHRRAQAKAQRNARASRSARPAAELTPLLDAIALAPGDDAPRRALAWRLRERGDPYAAFIEAQLAPERGANEELLFLQLAPEWLPPAGAFAWSRYDRGLLRDATVAEKPVEISELLEDWRFGTIERLNCGWTASSVLAYRELVTARTMTALREIEASALDLLPRCPAFQYGRLRGVRSFPVFDDAFNAPTFDWISDVHVDATDAQWPSVLERAKRSPFFTRRPRRMHIWNDGCSYVQRRQDLVLHWASLPLEGIATWDVALERTSAGTVVKLAGSTTVGGDGLYYPVELGPLLARHVPDLRMIETHGAAPLDAKHHAALDLPHVVIRHVSRAPSQRSEGYCEF